jgi:hypothetical protein
MEESKTVLGIVGSPNPEGRTNQLVMAALKGASDAGATTELIQLSEYVVAACKDCLPWVCVDTRFNFNQAQTRAVELGGQIAGMTKNRAPFKGLEERLVWYDNLPYLGLSLAGERRLLADLVALEVAEEMGSDVLSGLARSDAFTAAGRGVDSLSEVTRVYEAGVKAFERK